VQAGIFRCHPRAADQLVAMAKILSDWESGIGIESEGTIKYTITFRPRFIMYGTSILQDQTDRRIQS
jgi:hypothetical protein